MSLESAGLPTGPRNIALKIEYLSKHQVTLLDISKFTYYVKVKMLYFF